MKMLLIGIACVVVFVGGSAGLSWLYPNLILIMSMISFLGGAVGGVLMVQGTLELYDRR